MTTKDYILSILYRLIKYTKFLSATSLLSMISLILFPIFYVTREKSDALFALFVVFCVIWILTYLVSLIVSAIIYGRHVSKLPKVVKQPLQVVTVISIFMPYGSCLAMYFVVKNETSKIENDVIVVEKSKPISSETNL